MSSDVAIAHFGTANIHSVINAFHAAGADRVEIVKSAQDLHQAKRIVLPGQGALPTFMQGLSSHDEVYRALVDAVESGIPTLGICLGQQCLYQRSEEGDCDGLGWLEGEVIRFGDHDKKVPHMGWNRVRQTQNHPLWDGIDDGAWFYFVHSYFVNTARKPDCIGVTQYGVEYTSVSARDNLFATQFHPEKSGRDGLKLLHNFLVWDGTV